MTCTLTCPYLRDVSPQAFILYEEAVPDSKGEVTALQSIVGTLHRCRVFGPDNRCDSPSPSPSLRAQPQLREIIRQQPHANSGEGKWGEGRNLG